MQTARFLRLEFGNINHPSPRWERGAECWGLILEVFYADGTAFHIQLIVLD